MLGLKNLFSGAVSDTETNHAELEKQAVSKADVSLVSAYLKQTNRKLQENSNKTISLQGLMH